MCAVWLSNILKTDFFKGKPVVGEKKKKSYQEEEERKKKKTVVVKRKKKIELQFVIGKINK